MRLYEVFVRITESPQTLENTGTLGISIKKEQIQNLLLMAEDTGLEPAGLLHLTRFPGELLSHSVNPPRLCRPI